MPIPTPFHERTQSLCTSYRWTSWAGYHAVSSYDICHEREYNAFRQGTGVIDVSPLFKYDITGSDAAAFLSRVTVKNIEKLKTGRATYLCWTDDAGKIIDDGTCMRIDDGHYRITAAEPMFHWFSQQSAGFDVELSDVSNTVAALAIQGPTAYATLLGCTSGLDLNALKFFGVSQARFGDIEGLITRTGYTGDLGYEVWVPNAQAVPLWDTIFESGRPHNVHVAGLDALDVCRVEAGFIMMGVDYTGAFDAVIPSQTSTPYELGLGWTVNLDDRAPFIGQEALRKEKERGSAWSLIGLEISWEHLERLYDRYELPPALSSSAWRDAIPVYRGGRQVGRATSGTWSPTLKKNLALATVEADCAKIGATLDIEVTVEWERKTVPAKVVSTPFYNPTRKKAVGDDL
jgi:aminomethyltransferase